MIQPWGRWQVLGCALSVARPRFTLEGHQPSACNEEQIGSLVSSNERQNRTPYINVCVCVYVFRDRKRATREKETQRQ